MRHSERSWTSRLAGIGLALLIPGQALAHCGILVPDRHVHEHHVSAALAEAGGLDARVSPDPGDATCRLSDAVFMTSRALEQIPQAAPTSLPCELSPERLAAVSVAQVFAHGKLNALQPDALLIPLRL